MTHGLRIIVNLVTMSAGYKVYDHQLPHFVTSTVVGWVDALSRSMYKDIICESLNYCRQHKGLKLHAWVIMNNHFHLIISAADSATIGGLMRDIKKYTASSIIKAIGNNTQESRKEWMLNYFKHSGTVNNSNTEYQFWQQDYHPVALDTQEKFLQRMNYLHNNPVRAGIAWEAHHYKYSSAKDYYENKAGLIEIDKLLLY